MKRIIIGSILWVVFVVIGIFGSGTVFQFLIYTLFWTAIWGGMVYSGVKSVRQRNTEDWQRAFEKHSLGDGK